MNDHFSRRDFLNRAALAPLAGATVGLGVVGGIAFAQTPIKRAGGSRLKTSLNAYSFNKMLNDNLKGRGKGITLLELLDFCAEQNFDAARSNGIFLPRLSEGAQRQIPQRFQAAGVCPGAGHQRHRHAQ